jgi:N-acetylglucosaminyldiphosphoundecaprenol N-acetyl-beta-D-mannosaminyltransferase
MQRCYGPDFFAALMRATADEDIGHYLCGGAEGVADQLKVACAEKFDNRNVVGTHCPPFRPLTDHEFRELGVDVNESGADVVWIGISTPKQEEFAADLAKYTNASFIITVGAAFDFHIGAVRQAPDTMQKAGLEWLFRLLMEPRRLFRREMELVTGFIYYNLKELLTGHFFPNEPLRV